MPRSSLDRRCVRESSLFFVFTLLVACSDSGDETPHFKSPDAILRANCGTCHGFDAQGGYTWVNSNWPAPSIAGYPSAVIKYSVREGRPHVMPAIPEQEISDAELDALAHYLTGLPGSAIPNPPHDVTVTVLDEDPWFDPPQVSIAPRQTVRFVNAGATYHPVVELRHLLTGGRVGANSGNLGPGGVYYHTFSRTGVFTFLCGMHPYMRGEVHVGQSFTPPSYAIDPPDPPPAIPGIGEIWVLAQFQDWPGRAKDGVVQVIDASTWQVTHLIPVGNNPHNLWFDAGNQNALVTNWFDTTVSLINGSTKAVIGTYSTGVAPAHMTSDYSGTRWFVSIEGSNYVQVMTQAPGVHGLGGFLPSAPRAHLSGYGPHGIWFANERLVIANSMDSTFSIVDATSLLELACLPTGLVPLGAGCDSSGLFGATGNVLGNSVSFFDLSGLQWIRDVPVPGGAIQVPFTPDGRKVFAANGSFVTVIDVEKASDPLHHPDPLSVIDATILTGRGAHGVAFGQKLGGGTYAYVSHKFENYVSVIDVATLSKVGDIALTTTTTGKTSLAGATDTGGNGIAVRPNPPPWK